MSKKNATGALAQWITVSNYVYVTLFDFILIFINESLVMNIFIVKSYG